MMKINPEESRFAAAKMVDGQARFSDVLMRSIRTPRTAFEIVANLSSKSKLTRWSQDKTSNLYLNHLLTVLDTMFFEKTPVFTNSIIPHAFRGELEMSKLDNGYICSIAFPQPSCACMAIELNDHLIALQYNWQQEDLGWIYFIDTPKNDSYFEAVISELIYQEEI